MTHGPREINIPRPDDSTYNEPVKAWLYFEGNTLDLEKQAEVLLDFPGGGFIAMNPRCNDDRLMAWGGHIGVPILSLDYKKAPEFPYPYALNECFDVYRALVLSNGRWAGLSGKTKPRVLLSGDSAGGNLATALTIMVLEYNQYRSEPEELLPLPEGLMLMYPALDFSIGSWMSDEELELMNLKKMRRITKSILRRKSDYFGVLAAKNSQVASDHDSSTSTPESELSEDRGVALCQQQPEKQPNTKDTTSSGPDDLDTQLAVSSVITFTNDRIITPEMLRAMVMLYVGPNHRPDFRNDYLLSPLVAPDTLLARFPPVYIITGERDPLVDHTVLFAGRVRRAKERLGNMDYSNSKDFVEVHLIPGISHGFMQMAQVYPEAISYVNKTATWIANIFHRGETDSESRMEPPRESPWGLFNETAISGGFFGERLDSDLAVSGEREDGSEIEVDPMSSHSDEGAQRKDRTEPEALNREQIDHHLSSLETTIQSGRKTTISISDADLLRRRMKNLAAGLKTHSKGRA